MASSSPFIPCKYKCQPFIRIINYSKTNIFFLLKFIVLNFNIIQIIKKHIRRILNIFPTLECPTYSKKKADVTAFFYLYYIL